MNPRMKGNIPLIMLYIFITVFPFLIYPWGDDYYYANVKVLYFIVFVLTLWSIKIIEAKVKMSLFSLYKIRPVEWLFACFLVFIFFSTVYSVRPSFVGERTQHNGILVMISYALLFIFTSRSVSPFFQRKAIELTITSSFFVSVYGIFQYLGVKILPQDELSKLLFKQRILSFFDNPDYFGSYLVLLTVLTFSMYLSSENWRKTVYYLIILFTLGLALLLTETRSAWVGVIIGGTFLILTSIIINRMLWKKISLLIMCCIVLLLSMNLSTDFNYYERAVTIVNDAQKIVTNVDSGSAGASRWYIWKVSLPLIKEYFWLGSGPNTFQYVFHSGLDPDYWRFLSGGPIYDVNSEYLHIALTLGVPALVIYILIITTVIFAGIIKARHFVGSEKIQMYGLIASAIGYMTQAIFNINVVSVAPYYWMLMGFIYSISRKDA